MYEVRAVCSIDLNVVLQKNTITDPLFTNYVSHVKAKRYLDLCIREYMARDGTHRGVAVVSEVCA